MMRLTAWQLWMFVWVPPVVGILVPALVMWLLR